MYYPPARNTNNDENRRITVYGNSRLTVKPSIAEVQLGVEVRNNEVNAAQQENSQRIQQVIQSLVRLGIPQDQIQTVDYQIYPQYDYVDGEQQFRGYQVTHMLMVKSENINQVGLLIDTAVQNGANRISSIRFTVKNLDAYYQQALKLALENSVLKAQTLAKVMNVSLDPIPVEILEQTTTPPPIPYQAMAETGLVAGVTTPIEPGQIEVESKLETKFKY
ncbi:hypothetical protein SAMN05192533_11635 [Mesobacillus persicus]|uniref:DUF541 domain-containing protein n=1 Tax=Mesobacillus persicus TaxID=930146 RepID=A0A1H8I1P0_9BACI|nr:SIMPL domain-containing protein [Mesobacillus persicus]SEN62660.1 hypothetical protein SAMN05192533_11635 [Mesobacillus persicus]